MVVLVRNLLVVFLCSFLLSLLIELSMVLSVGYREYSALIDLKWQKL